MWEVAKWAQICADGAKLGSFCRPNACNPRFSLFSILMFHYSYIVCCGLFLVYLLCGYLGLGCLGLYIVYLDYWIGLYIICRWVYLLCMVHLGCLVCMGLCCLGCVGC